ncbi:putative MFS-type transporter [Pseudocercospora fuligena]|uniref:Putative MFS-type transporter n=1 Tax=Pseudocercospora fuligena TaxID=685502 RepID=A0A8H6RPP5_9PEZI|nr:putative MFS-type transporter [Pseudocercospora fuligena]
MEKDPKTTIDRVEDVEDDTIKPVLTSDTMGTVTIADAKDIFLVPTPSADPRVSSVGLALVSGFGGLLSFYIPEYAEHGATYADITALMTYPTMFMGVGNLVLMPIAMAVGRRPIYLFSCVVLVVAAIGAAYVKDYNQHLGVRMILGFAAGQSEALVPMMIQEVHFLHERSTFLMWQSAIQTITTAVYVLFASPIAGSIGPGNWYILGGGLAAIVLLVSIPFVPESKYDRSLAAYGQATEEEIEQNPDLAASAKPVRMSERPAFDLVRYQPRTIWSDMRLFVNEADWWEGWYTFFHTFQILLFPNVFWAFCLNGLTLGVNIALGTTYSTIVTSAPYNWPASSASYVTPGQIVTALVALPLLGYGSDKAIKWRSRRNGGVHEPENRLILLWIPILIGAIACVIYGQAGAHPEKFHWFAIAWSYAAYYFAFVGANIAGITYLLDAYPARAAPVLVVITAMRGFVSFGTSYGVARFIETDGYDGSFGAYAGLTAAVGLLGVPVFFYGKRIRQYTGKWATKSRTGRPSMAH